MRQESEPAGALPFTVLVVDDDPVQCRLVQAAVLRAGGRCETEHGVDAAWRRLAAPGGTAICVLVLDILMPDGNGLDLLRRLRTAGLTVPVVVQTARAGLDTVVEAMRAGACDFLVKPASPAKIRAAVEAALRTLGDGQREADPPALAAPAPDGSPGVMAQTLRMAAKAARSAIPVLLLGETGTGKEWLARRIVAAGPRAGAPFVAVNCGALPRDLAESILFGHERGAFTGAAQRSPGRFGEADGGTLFLDEVGDLAPEVQVKLLRALQEGEIDPVGAARPVRTDIRIIAATHRDLAADVAAGRFREDLYYRLNVFPVRVPPLRERRDEIAGLATGFAERWGAGRRAKRLSADALRVLERGDWPGNIRQLENAVYRAVVLSDGDVLTARDFGGEGEDVPPDPAGDAAPPSSAPASRREPSSTEISQSSTAAPDRSGAGYAFSMVDAAGEIVSLAAAESRLIALAVERYDGRLSKAARHLGIGRSTLYRKMRAYGIARPEEA